MAVLLGGASRVAAIYEKNKGINEWYIENLGELQDLKFVEEDLETEVPKMIYSVTTDGVLSLMDLTAEKFIWKRQLTSQKSNGIQDAPEEFKLSYLSRNLLVYSKQRALLVNTAGHANLEIDFGVLFGKKTPDWSKSNAVATMFDYEGQVFSCFALGNKAVIYKAARLHQTIQLDSNLEPDSLQLTLEQISYDT